MQSLSYDHARKITEKYLALLSSPAYKHLKVTDVHTIPSRKQPSKAIIQVINQNGDREDLDNFCLRNDVAYDLK